MADEPTPTPAKADPAEPEGKTLTQEQIDKIVENRLAREREKQQTERDAEKQKLEDEKKSAEQKLLDRIAALEEAAKKTEKDLTESQLESLRLRVAQAKGLSESQANRLQGSTKEELEADADDLIETFGGKKDDQKEELSATFGRPKEKLTPGASNEDDETVDYKKIADDIASSESF
jgi:hypothetical protein